MRIANVPRAAILARCRAPYNVWVLNLRVSPAALLLAATFLPAVSAATLDEAAAPGKNYDKAEFRLWYPDGAASLGAAVILMPGSNGDGRNSVDDPVWQAFAIKHSLALVGCRFTDKPHEQSFIEEYANVSQGSGQALLDAMAVFAVRSKHAELASAPFLLWGMSAGGQFNYEFVAWKAERVIAFVVNKGGIYYTALAPRAARAEPGMLFIGGKDLDSRIDIIRGLFALNRRAGALWAIAEEPAAAHIVGRSRDVSIVFFEDAMSLRLGKTGLQALNETSGFLADPKLKSFHAETEGKAPAYPLGWIPSERIARAWLAMETEKPFEQ
jgi:dienelactone hydrolase